MNILVALCSGVHLLWARLAVRFSIIHSVLVFWAGSVCLTFGLLFKFLNVLKPRKYLTPFHSLGKHTIH